MDPKVNSLIKSLTDLGGKAPSEVMREWRKTNSHITDFADATFDGLDLSGCNFSGLDLTDVRFFGCKLAGAAFTDAVLNRCMFLSESYREGGFRTKASNSGFGKVAAENAVFRGDFDGCAFEGAKLQRATFDGSSLRAARFSEANLNGVSFRNVAFDRRTMFQNPEDVQDCTIDRYALACLDNFGGLTVGNRMDMRIIDDVALLRQQFSGIWMWGHAIGLSLFLFPYLWFLFSNWAVAAFRPADSDQETIALWEALARFIVSGGEEWKRGLAPSWIPFVTFILVLAYNFARAILLWKTKLLETEQTVSELPVRFSLAEPAAGIPVWFGRRIGRLRWWSILYRINRWGLVVSLVFVAINTAHFLTMRVPV